MPRDNYSERKRTFSPVATLVGWLLSVLVFLLISLVISIIIEWVGMFTLWEDEGVNHSRKMLSNELRYANENIANNAIVGDARETVAKSLYEFDSAVERAGALSGAIGNNNIAADLAEAALNTMKTFILRLFVITFSLPLFLLAFWYAVIDGGVERELRKYGGDGESNVIFDYTSKLSIWVVSFGCMLYLAMPFSVNPVLVILPTFILFFSLTRTTVANYKKKV